MRQSHEDSDPQISLLIQRLAPKKSIDPNDAKYIHFAKDMKDPIFVEDENGNFPDFSDGYNKDFYYDDDDREALGRQTQFILLQEMDARFQRRERLQQDYEAAKARWEEAPLQNKREKNFDELQKKYNTGTPTETSDYDTNDEGNTESDGFVENDAVLSRTVEKTARISLKDMNGLFLPRNIVDRFFKRIDFRRNCEGLIVRIKNTKKPMQINGVEGDDLERLVRGVDLGTLDPMEVKVEDLDEDEFTDNELDEGQNIRYSRKEMTQKKKNREKIMSTPVNQSAFYDNLYRQAMDNKLENLDEVIYQYQQFIKQMEQQYNDADVEDTDEELANELDEKKGNLARLQKLLEEKKKEKESKSMQKINKPLTLAEKVHAKILKEKKMETVEDKTDVVDNMSLLGDEDSEDTESSDLSL